MTTIKTPTPRDFRNAFVAVMRAEHNNFQTAVGFEAKSYNFFMRSQIFPRISKRLGLSAWTKDYHGLDGMFYEERAKDDFGKFTAYVKWISVAVVHAGKPTRTHEEISKLQMFNAALKVLITYVGEGAAGNSLLSKYEAVIRDSDIFGDIATRRQQLVIFGTPQVASEWRFYAYESDGFVLMLPGN